MLKSVLFLYIVLLKITLRSDEIRLEFYDTLACTSHDKMGYERIL